MIVNEEYYARINKKVNNYFAVSNQTLKKNYFKYRFQIKTTLNCVVFYLKYPF